VESVFSTDLLKISIEDFIMMMSKQHNITILLPDEYPQKLSLYISTNPDKKMYMAALRDVLYLNNLKLKKKKNYYVIIKKEDEVSHDYTYSIKYMNPDEIKVLQLIFTEIKFHYFKSSNIIAYNAKVLEHQQITKLLSNIDKLDEQLTVKVTIFQTNLNDIQKLGIETGYQGQAQISDNYFLNILTSASAPTNVISAVNAKYFYSFINALDQNGTSKVLYNPYVLVQNQKQVMFSVVDNIKRVQTTTSFQSATTQNTTNFKYEDVGLKLSILPKIVNDEIYIKLNLSIEDLVGAGDNQIISRKNINNEFHVKLNEIIVLSGFRKEVTTQTQNRIPYLSTIPYLGVLFTSYEDTTSNTVLSISLQVTQAKRGVTNAEVLPDRSLSTSAQNAGALAIY